jgi:hypothetical protein
MGAKKVRGLLLAAAAGALLASGAAASFYSYETSWQRSLREPAILFWLSFVAGDDSAIGVSYSFQSGTAYAAVCYVAFDADGQPLYGGAFWEKYTITLDWSSINGFALINGGAVAAFSVAYYDDYSGEYFRESYLKFDGEPGWEIKMTGSGHFQALARSPDGQYIYCYRYYLGDYWLCKMTAAGTVVSYFRPVARPDDLAVDAAGYIYALSDDRIRKYNDAGSLLVAWYAPVELSDVSVDKQNRVLGFSYRNRYGYVFSDAGALLGSFTGPYGGNVYHGDAGPGGKYYVGREHRISEFEYGVEMYRFAPSPTNIVPTSLGKIKAVFN